MPELQFGLARADEPITLTGASSKRSNSRTAQRSIAIGPLKTKHSTAV